MPLNSIFFSIKNLFFLRLIFDLNSWKPQTFGSKSCIFLWTFFVKRTVWYSTTITQYREYLFIPTFIPDPETQRMVNESIRNSFTLTFDSWTRDRKTINTELDYHFDIGSSSNFNSRKSLNAACQTKARASPANKANKIAIFNHVVVIFSRNWRILKS